MSPAIKLYVILLLILSFEVIVPIYLTSPKRLGRVFEKHIVRTLNRLDKHGIYGKALRNIYLPKNEYETSEIDVLYITTVGLFVIECKNYKGWIFGKSNDLKWTVSLPRGRGKSSKRSFLNPLKQNMSHIKPLRNYIITQFPDRLINIYPIVVFSDRGTLKKITNYSDQPVGYTREMLEHIKKVAKDSNPVLTQVQVDSLYESMLPMTKVSKEVKKQHIENIRKKSL